MVYIWVDNVYRVRLKSTATPGSDYINASFIDVRAQESYSVDGGNVLFECRVTDREILTLLLRGHLSQQQVIFGEWFGRRNANVLCSCASSRNKKYVVV